MERRPARNGFTLEQLKALGEDDSLTARNLMLYLAAECWPDGFGDRGRPRGWRPAASSAPSSAHFDLPACACAEGRCQICN